MAAHRLASLTCRGGFSALTITDYLPAGRVNVSLANQQLGVSRLQSPLPTFQLPLLFYLGLA